MVLDTMSQAYYAKLSGENLSRYLNGTESV